MKKYEMLLTWLFILIVGAAPLAYFIWSIFDV